MKKRELGNSGMEVAPLAFGGNVFGWTADEPTSFRLLDAFTAAGGNLVDTADVYSNWVPGNSGGESESILGRWLAKNGNREKVLVATKVGKPMGPGRSGLSKSYILRAAEDSLRRLRTDRIDLYQAHEDDPAAPQEETLEAYSQLIRQGKVRAIGASNFTPKRLEESLETGARLGLPVYCSLQPRYNLYDRAEFERELLPLCLANGLGVIPYFSLASGFLAGKYRTGKDLAGRARGGFVKGYLNERGFRILDALDRVASEHRASLAAVALSWLIARAGITAPIASATTPGQLHDLTEAMRLELDPDSIQLLDDASA